MKHSLSTLLTLLVVAFVTAPTEGQRLRYSRGYDNYLAAAQALPLLAQQDFDTATGTDDAGATWSFLQRTGFQDPAAVVVTDGTAPRSGSNVLEYQFAGTNPDTEPGVTWVNFSHKTEVFAEWWMKLSTSWTNGTSGSGKVNFFFPAEGGIEWSGIGCRSGSILNCATDSEGDLQAGVNVNWVDGSEPNVTRAPNTGNSPIINRNEWHKYGVYMKWETAPITGDGNGTLDGILRVWVDNVLTHNYTDIEFPAADTVGGTIGFIEFQFAVTRQCRPSQPGCTDVVANGEDERMSFDHVTVRGQ